MQATNNPAPAASDVQAHADALAAEATARAVAKREAADAKRAARAATSAKPTPAKPAKREAVAKPAKPAKPDTAQRDAKREADLSDRRQARIDAANAVKAYYNGASLPFKAAADRFADLRLTATPKRPTQRQAALLASMLLAGDNVKATGLFTRGAFVIDGRNVQPETGCLSDMLGRVISYVSGPTSGPGQRDAVFKIDLAKARTEISEQIGGTLARAALARLDTLAPVKPAKR